MYYRTQVQLSAPAGGSALTGNYTLRFSQVERKAQVVDNLRLRQNAYSAYSDVVNNVSLTGNSPSTFSYGELDEFLHLASIDSFSVKHTSERNLGYGVVCAGPGPQ